MHLKLSSLLAVVFCTTASFVFGQAEVEERVVISDSQTAKAKSKKSQSAEGLAELYYQLQLLQEEVLQLRGIVEEQNFQIKKLKQQRLDDYVDLDRRISQVSAQGNSTTTTVTGAQPASQAPVGPAPSVTQPVREDEFKRYKDAYRLATQDAEKAEVALKQFVQDFPQSKYVANGLFVLGELKLKAGELEDARAWYMRVVLEHPKHYRSANAKLKLGNIFHKQGDMEQAKQYWTDVANSNSSAAQSAAQNLEKYF